MGLLQKIIILLNFKPFIYIFHSIYAYGLKMLVSARAKQPAVHSIFGRGSFFENRCLYGLSDNMLGYFSEGAFPDRDRYADTPECLSMVRQDGYKFISAPAIGEGKGNRYGSKGFANHKLAVFDLTSDPYEYVNLIDTKQGQDVLDWAVSTHRNLK